MTESEPTKLNAPKVKDHVGSQHDQVKRGGETDEYVLHRLKRDHPDLLHKVRRGDLTEVHQAKNN